MRFRAEDGQASIEHVGLVAVIALVLVGAGATVAVAAPSVVNRVTTGFQRALCTVTGEACVTLAREPCPTLRTTKTTAQGVTLGAVHLGHDRVLFIERRSDGTYVMSQVEGEQRGFELSHGATAGPIDLDASGTIGYHVGRTYTAATPEEARALVAKLRRQPFVAASAVVAGAADLIGLAKTDPSVSSYVVAGTGAIDALAKFGLGDFFDVGVSAHANGEIGARIAAHDKQITAYVKLDGNVNAFFDMLPKIVQPYERSGGAGAAPIRGEAKASNPAGYHQSGGLAAGGSLAIQFGPGGTIQQVEVVGYAGLEGGTGHRTEYHARLDPSDPAVRDAIAALGHAPTSGEALAGLGRAAASSAAVDIRHFTTTDTQGNHEHGGTIGDAGLSLGLTFGSRTKTQTLTEERSLPVGGIWETRLDCVA